MAGAGVRRTTAAAAAAALVLAACTSPAPTAEPTSAAPTSSAQPLPSSDSASPSGSSSPTATVSPSVAATTSPTASAATAASCPKGFSQAALRACVKRATAVYVAAWTRQLESRGVTGITPPTVAIFGSPPTNPCIDLSETDAVEASFWCGKSWTIYVSANAAKYWTTQYVTAARERGVLASDAAAAGTSTASLAQGLPLVGTTTELAHELGHWVQEVAGQRPWFDARLASSSFTTSNRATVIGELSADCMAGWVQGRTAADGTWVDTRIGTWAHHATMAELGGDVYAVKKGFVFPPEKPKDIIGYGSAYSRIRLYDVGYAAGRADGPGLSLCTTTVAGLIGSSAPPSP